MKIETIIGRTHHVDTFDKLLKDTIVDIEGKNKNNNIVDVTVIPCERLLYGLIKYERRTNRSETKEVSST